MSLVIFTQTFGGSLALTVAQLIFNSRRIVHAGATAFSSVVTPGELPSVLNSHAYALI
jgi:hypothetical protein